MSSCSESSSAWFVSKLLLVLSVLDSASGQEERLLPNFEKGTAAELHPLLRPLMVRFESQGSLLYGVSDIGHPIVESQGSFLYGASVMKKIEAEGSYFKTSDIVGKTQLPLPST